MACHKKIPAPFAEIIEAQPARSPLTDRFKPAANIVTF
jgi:hypothetical protein